MTRQQREQIADLGFEAAMHGDAATARLSEDALDGDTGAIAWCLDVIAQHHAAGEFERIREELL